MTISIYSLLNKMELEMTKARQTEQSAQIREHIYSIKTLCDIILEDNFVDREVKPIESSVVTIPSIQTASVGKSEPLKTEDGSNGDSIFDF